MKSLVVEPYIEVNVTSMQPTPTTQGRHALRWVLGVALVFVVVVGIGLQVARHASSAP